ncbi:hypothetical protein GGS24DRAFT_448871 [Hypoxylon argillaceum]|nr:hypothetical protein GGS24DRAFT_448871 [Hypoxylon argillaceum]
MPDGSSGGLVQYDLGKDNGDKGFQLKGFLSPPPEALRNAVRGMMSDHRLHGSKIEQFISEIAQKYKNSEEFCRRPPSASDVLFAADYAHIQNNMTCEGCDKERLLARLDRGSDDSEIHYGLIASGDSVIKDGAKRDSIVGRLAASGNKVLCFEMEAAGLATESSYLVIRGISDYADSHKNDVWQHYAATAAAACTKEILEQLQHEDSEDLEASGSHGNRGTGARISHSNFIGHGLQNAGNIQAGRDVVNSWGRN